jgi:transposase
MPKIKHLTGAAREKLAIDFKRKYDGGASVRAIAEECGRSYGFVHTLLSEADTTMRGRGGALRTTTSTSV